MDKRFNKSLEVLLHYGDKIGDFKTITEDFKTLIETNERLTEEVVNTKIESIQFKEEKEIFIKELAETKIALAEIRSKLNIGGTV